MTKRHQIFLSITLSAIGLFAVILGGQNINGSFLYAKNRSANTYSIKLDSTNAFTTTGSGTKTIYTSLNNSVQFSYTSCSPLDGGHAKINQNGTIVNDQQITSVESILPVFTTSTTNTELQFRASFDKETWGEWSSLKSGTSRSLSSEPYYFEFKAVNGAVNLTSLLFEYSCVANSEAAGTQVTDPGDTIYKLLKSGDSIDVGDEIIIAGKENSNYYYCKNAVYNSYYLYSYSLDTSVDSKTGDILADADGVTIWTVGGTKDAYTFKAGNNYLSSPVNTSHYNIGLSSSVSNNCKYQVTIGDDYSTIYCTNTSNYVAFLLYNNKTPEFKGDYGNKNNISIFKKIVLPGGTHTEYDKPVYETGLVHSTSKTTFNVNETFASCLDSSLNVQVRMSNGTLKSITKSDYQVKVLYNGSSEININSTFPHSGSYVVEISYAGLIPIRYNINVSNVTTSITATKTKTTYNIGDSISLSDISAVKNYYVDGSSSSISYANFASNDLGCTLTNPNSVTVSSGTFNVAGYWKAKVYLLSNPSVYSEIPIEVAVVPVTGITLNTSTATVNIGETITLTPTISPSNATDKTVTWSTSSSTYATVSNGVVTGKAEGQVTITAKAGNYSASCVVTVKSVKVTGVTMSPTSLSINIGETSTLSANISPVNATNKSVTWSSSNSCVTINANGVITGVSAGSATITVTTSDGGFTATCSVTCKAVAVTSITLSPESLSLYLGGSKASVTATVAPSNATDKTVTWTIDKTSIATISASGSTVEVTPVAAGTATLTATSGSITKTCTITVSAAAPEWTLVTSTSDLVVGQKYVITQNAKGMTAGDISSQYLTVKSSTFSSDKTKITTLSTDAVQLTLGGSSDSWTFKNSSGNFLGATAVKKLAWGSGTTTWSISIDTSKNATIQNSTSTYGRFLYNANSGQERFTTYTSATSATMLLPQLYTLKSGSGGGGGGSTDVKVTDITISPSSSTLDIGETVTLSTSITPTNATNKAVTWSSDDEDVASVSTSGVVTANGAGTCTITATAKDGSGVTGTASISVKQPVATLSSISISGQKTEYSIGESFVKPTVTAHYSDGTTANVTSTAEFSGFSSTSSGQRTITVSYTEDSITKTVTYTINVKSSGGTVVTGDEYQITFKAAGADNSTNLTSSTIAQQIATGSEYISSYNSMDKVYAGTSGLKMGSSKSGGYLDFNVSNTISSNEAVSIAINVAQYGSDVGNVNVYINGSDSATVSVDPSASSSATASIDSGVMIESIRIASGKRAYILGLTISTKPLVPVDPTSISVSPSTLTMSLSETSKLSVSYTPSNANQNKGITWSTSNKNVATVSSDGTVTAVAKGTATITATSTKGLTATCNVEVKEIAVSGITMSPTSATVSKGATKQLSASISPYNATNQGITWSTNKSTVATVDSNGLVTAVAVGSATITATAQGDTSKTATCTITVTEQTKDAWTILMYVCGADLESESGLASGDFDEILSVYGQPNDVNIVIQTGGAKTWDSSYGYGINASNNQRYHVENRKLVCDNSKVYTNYQSMGSSTTLADFVGWGMKEYPAEKTGIIFWNHGGGMRGVCYDEKKSDDALLNSEIKSGITSGISKAGLPSGTKLEFVGFDACLMAVQDIADYASTYANYMVASEESEAGYGWDYDNWVDDLYAKESTDVILKAICDSFIADNGGVNSNKNDQTLSYLNLAYAQEYKTAWENMATALTTKLGNTSASTFINWVGNNVKHYAENDYNYFHLFDAKDFVNKLASNSNYNPGSTYTSAVLTAHSKLVAYSTCGRKAGNSYGLCMVFVYTQDREYSLINNYYTTTETGFTKWRTFNTVYGDLK